MVVGGELKHHFLVLFLKFGTKINAYKLERWLIKSELINNFGLALLILTFVLMILSFVNIRLLVLDWALEGLR